MNTQSNSFKSGEIDPGFQPITVPNPQPGERDFSIDTLLRLSSGHFIAGCQDAVYYQIPCLVRINPDHSVDTTFGQDGYAFIDLSNEPLAENAGHLLDVYQLPDGGYLARLDTIATLKGQRLSCLVLACFTVDGQKDPNFGNDGIRLYPLPGPKPQWPEALRKLASPIPSPQLSRFPHERYHDLKVLSDGKLLILTTARELNENTHRPYVLRLTAEGELDPTFNSSGFMEPVGYMWFKPHRLLEQNNGMLVISGEYPGIPFIARFHENGTLDTTYGDNGYFTDLGPYAYTRWHTLLPDAAQNIVCVGQRGGPTFLQGRGVTVIGKLDVNGQRVPEFNQGQSVLIEPREAGDVVLSNFTAIVDQANRIVIGGRQLSPVTLLTGFMARLLQDGQADTSLGENGVLYYEDLQSLDYLLEEPGMGVYYSVVLTSISPQFIHRFLS
ncbi:hypothetical protein ALQ04_01739 [Pseudomonas cichorii]|uniref:Uncharacterized protein n=1 Tax=Pseudomonas cichorii TaxID=36746 RepID=A0A3M4LSU9_PSECI|nr:hypothetical protein [Pseudomonas cichorii]RMQ44490.1 hypothetical protein ALQ04_01739 [Pseudomonas cichorii]